MSSTKEYILASIKKNTPTGKHPYPAIPAFPKSNKPILEEFKENLEAAAGLWYEIDNPSEAETRIKQLHPEAKVICSATSEIEGNKDINKITDPHDTADVDVGIIRASFGVSETGMVWIREQDLVVNALGFLSQHLIILLKPEELVRDMYEAYTRVELEKDNYGCFMLGPSATADIGAVMVRGAQGARSLTVFFM
ncbi:L-lactate dehydrogenase complex protein LldG [Parabacteroides sp. PF5-5]|uniref:LutC/YkgG family protein n=1 Tax=unclassified Parabacteroides TaxID=2649774 RepID=UPI0024737256|nr:MULTISPECIES: LUD domain-containing protein [unclassified Parabacteroides]MDH6315044.1 L-lactate dehydrogenase complex protein LldG [Parabacteroides sp. PF5-13]MDH6326431.1 L-lactate dehydrogenase complex protein LldG [Parabacteroides sp. PH5-41]MDH6334231.1 L-lactate dehydrogenase complex protein LldG [Parabacteroides sp. PF5-5]MDH6345099.1 L-lactate dehydrogenase complex protein LldG [Parabacteroides sp. PH5-46]MDH6360252.1 L-lactate dehydrogenase complex protein LldG [Parabacteroides sp.